MSDWVISFLVDRTSGILRINEGVSLDYRFPTEHNRFGNLRGQQLGVKRFLICSHNSGTLAQLGRMIIQSNGSINEDFIPALKRGTQLSGCRRMLGVRRVDETGRHPFK